MSGQTDQARAKAILVVGGGVSGITVAVEAAETGFPVYLVERGPSLGGRVARMNKYFPKLCPPACGLEINYRRIRRNSAIHVLTDAEVRSVSGQAGAFDVTVQVRPRFVNEKCTACDKCVDVCPVERPNEFNYGMDTTKAIYRPHDTAYPELYAIDEAVCEGASCGKCVEACPYGAIELDMAPKTVELKVGAIVTATGWAPYDAHALESLRFGTSPNVITNVMMERLAAPGGPTGGKIVRPSDGGEVKTAVFVQCAGSRDVNHLPYCSSVCCLASLKQASYLREQDSESKAYMFYIDRRAHGLYENFLAKIETDDGVVVKKGKVAKVEEDPESGKLTVHVEDILEGGRIEVEADLVVLATGMTPEAGADALPFNLERDAYGFLAPDGHDAGFIAAGTAKGPTDVATAIQDATGAALKAIQALRAG
jgi:quinone-modifying oxidoreductase subunit QmoA